MYEMLTVRRPFLGDVQTLTGAIRRDEPSPVERLCADLPSGVADVVRRCLAKQPPERYPRCHGLLAALQVTVANDAFARKSDSRRLWRAPIPRSRATPEAV